MRRKILVTVTVFLLLSTLIPIVNASHITWVAFDPRPEVGSDSAILAGMFDSIGNIGIFVINVAQNVIGYRCDSTTLQCSDTTLHGNGQGFDANIGTTGDGLFVACFKDNDQDAHFKKSGPTQPGLSWTDTVAVLSTSSGDHCTSASYGSVAFSFLYDSTTDRLVYAKSSTGGGPGSFGATTATSATTEFDGSSDMVAYAVNETHIILMAATTANLLHICYTEDGVATPWVCATSSTGADSISALQYEGNEDFIFTTRTSAGDITYNTLSGFGSGPTEQTVATGQGASPTRPPSVNRSSNGTVGVAWSTIQGATGDEPARFSETMENGDFLPESDERIFATGAGNTHGGGGGMFYVPSTDVRLGIWAYDDADNGAGVRPIVAPFYAGDLISAAAIETVADPVGFDIDTTGNLILIRYDNGDDVATHDSLTLGQTATFDTDCLSDNGVMVQTDGTDTFAFYVDCDAGDPVDMHIRTGSLGVPTENQLNGCGTSCATFTLDGFSSAGGDGLNDLGEIDAFPISYREQDDPGGIGDAHSFYLAWGWGSLDSSGFVGVNAFSNHQSSLGPQDVRESYEIDYGSGNNAAQICTGVDGEQTYLASVRSGGNSIVYPIDFTLDQQDGGILSDLVPVNGGTPATYSSVQAGGEGVSCGDHRVAIVNGGGVWVMGRSGGVVRQYDLEVPRPRGVSISRNTTEGQFVAYADDALWFVSNVDTGEQLCSGPIPTGDIIGFQLTGAAQNLYVLTDGILNNLARFAIAEEGCTPIQDEVPGGGGGTPSPTPGPGTSEGDILEFLASSTFIGLLLIVALALLGYLLLQRNRGLGAAIGSALGLAIAGFSGWFHPAVVFTTLALVVGIGWIKSKR